MAALFPAERIGGLASLQPATLRLAADVRYGGHSRRSDGQQGLAECPLCLQWRPNLCVATNRRDVCCPQSEDRTLPHTVVGNTAPCIAANLAANVSVGSKTGKSRSEQMLSALPPLATGERTFWIGSFVPPISDIAIHQTI